MDCRLKKIQSVLHKLGYFHKVDAQSVPLVERLVADLTTTTENLKKYMEIAQNAIEERDNLQIGAEPYKCDNTRLVKEYNDLLLIISRNKQENEQREKELQQQIECLETEKFKWKREKACMEKHIQELKESLIDQPEIIPKNRQKMISRTKSCQKTTKNCEISSALALADEKIVKLTNDIKKLKEHNVGLLEANEILQAQIINRDKEMSRLNIDSNHPLKQRECCCNTENKPVRDGDINKLIQEKTTLENRLKDALAKQHEAMKRALHLAERNKLLEMEMKDIDRLAMAVEVECNNTVKCSSEKVDRLQDRMHSSVLQIQQLERDNAKLKQDVRTLSADLDAVQLEKKHLQTVLESSLDEKKRLSDRINNFTIIERDLNLEIDRLTRISVEQKRKISELESTVAPSGRTDSSAYDTTRIIIDNLRSEKEYYMKEYHKALEQVNQIAASATGTMNTLEKTNLTQKLVEAEKSLANLRHENKLLLERLDSNQINRDDSKCLKPQCKRIERECNLLRSDLERLEEQRDDLQLKFKNTSENQVQNTDRYKKALMEAEEHIKKLEFERTELIQTAETRKSTITTLENQLEMLRDELKRTLSELNHQKAIYTQLKVLHEQTDKALLDTQNKLTSVDSELVAALENARKRDLDRGLASKEVETLKNDIQIMKNQLTQLDQEKDALLVSLDDKTEELALIQSQLNSKDKTISSLETMVNDLKKKISSTIDESANQEHLYRTTQNELIQLKQELESARRINESSMEENRRLQSDLAAVMCDNRDARKELDLYKRQVDDLKTQLQHYVAEVKRTEDLISNKEIERNELLDQFRSLSQEANILENNNHTLETEASQSKIQLSVALDHAASLERRLENKESIIQSYEKQITELTSQLASLEIQLKQLMAQCDRNDFELQNMRDLCSKLDMENNKYKRVLRDREEQKMQSDRNFEELKSEREKLQYNLTKDKRNAEAMENILDEAKNESSELKMLNQDLREEVQRLKVQLQEIKDRFIISSEQVDMYQEKALQYSQQNKQLRRELANERFRRTRDSESTSTKYPSL